MAHRLLRDAEADGWERSDFPIICESCLGDSPYVRMTKADYDKECKICTRPFTVFRWRPGRDARYKKTEICQTCSKLKNVCQVCLLDLEYGLPVQVRDTAFSINSNDAIPKSDVNREYFAEEHDRRARAGIDYESSYGKVRPNDTIMKLQRTSPYYKRNRAHVCSFYIRGQCTRGLECPYRHEMPETGELSQQNIKDRYYGVNDPVALKLLNKVGEMPSLEAPCIFTNLIFTFNQDSKSSMCSSNSLYINPKPCKHLADYKVKNGMSGYSLIQECFKTTPYGRTTLEISKSELPRCSICSGHEGRFYMCLICSSVLCCLSPESNHALLHSQCKAGHEISVDMERAELYCSVCCDQVYDPDFDKVVMCKHIMGFPRTEIGVVESELRLSKRRRLSFGMDLDSKNMKTLFLRRDQKSKSCFPLVLRGLNNLGNTCFMNSVLQVLLHAPPLRNYFLSDRHNRDICRKMSSDRLCLPCDIDLIFSAVFSGDRTPYSPARFLYSWWQHSENLATYEQQDAHEFFISVMDRIHDKEGKASLATKDNGDCQCIAHRTFYGLLRSDVTCTSCGFTSTTHDPCMDISLDLNSCNSSPKDFANKSSKPNESLVGCLDLFTRPEKLGSDQKLYCENCQEKQDALKQMSIKKLPLVLSFHIKRFEHSPTRKMSRKIDRHLQFPFSLDMKPYLSSSIVRKRYGNRIFSFDGDESDISTEFEIFAVVTHSGMLESGHYVTYLRLRNQWYKCDDAWITEVDEEVVRASQCYLMYYVQKMLYHKSCEDVSCQPMSLRADTFVPIAGCC